jgi:hypothetical protein
MEEDHKIFQQKLDELKSSMVNTHPEPRRNDLYAKGDDILAELDKMKERLQQARNKQTLHPSDNTLKNIVIENPISQKVDPTGYAPDYKDRSFNDLDRSLPGQTALKTGLNNSQNFKLAKDDSINDRIEIQKLDDSSVDLEFSELKEKPKKKRIVKKIKQKTKLGI